VEDLAFHHAWDTRMSLAKNEDTIRKLFLDEVDNG
jgi:hypothetical protein